MTNLDGLQRCVSNDDFLRESAFDEGSDLLLRRIVLDGLSKIDEGGSGGLSKGRLRTDEVDEIGNGRQPRESRVGDWRRNQI